MVVVFLPLFLLNIKIGCKHFIEKCTLGISICTLVHNQNVIQSNWKMNKIYENLENRSKQKGKKGEREIFEYHISSIMTSLGRNVTAANITYSFSIHTWKRKMMALLGVSLNWFYLLIYHLIFKWWICFCYPNCWINLKNIIELLYPFRMKSEWNWAMLWNSILDNIRPFEYTGYPLFFHYFFS